MNAWEQMNEAGRDSLREGALARLTPEQRATLASEQHARHEAVLRAIIADLNEQNKSLRRLNDSLLTWALNELEDNTRLSKRAVMLENMAVSDAVH